VALNSGIWLAAPPDSAKAAKGNTNKAIMVIKNFKLKGFLIVLVNK